MRRGRLFAAVFFWKWGCRSTEWMMVSVCFFIEKFHTWRSYLEWKGERTKHTFFITFLLHHRVRLEKKHGHSHIHLVEFPQKNNDNGLSSLQLRFTTLYNYTWYSTDCSILTPIGPLRWGTWVYSYCAWDARVPMIKPLGMDLVTPGDFRDGWWLGSQLHICMYMIWYMNMYIYIYIYIHSMRLYIYIEYYMISYNMLKYMHIIWYNIRIPEAIPSKHPMDPVVHPWGVRRAPRSSLSSEPGADEATNDMPKDRWYLGAKMRISATIYIYIYIE